MMQRETKMRTMKTLTLAGSWILLGALLAPTARAGDCGCDCGGRSYRTARARVPLIRTGSGTTSYRNPYHRSTRYVVPRSSAFGTPWSVLRGYLPRGREDVRRLHVRNYFLRRSPFAVAPGIDVEQATSLDTLLALGEDVGEGPVTLDATGHLDRGMGRFFMRDYAAAREDFEAALKASPKEHRARYGLVMVAFCKNEWRTAAKELAVLGKAGEIKRGDVIEAKACFRDPTILKRVTDGLRQYAGYAITDSNAHLVTAWALAGQGELKAARRYLRLAKRRKPNHAAVLALEKSLASAPTTKSAAKQDAKPAAQTPQAAPAKRGVPATPLKTEEPEHAPRRALHREIASTGK